MSRRHSRARKSASTGEALSIKDLLKQCEAPLRDFEPTPDDREGFARGGKQATGVSITPERLPVPESIILVMTLLVGAHDLGRSEKLKWEYPFRYNGHNCSISQEKFGLRLYISDASLQQSQESAGALSQAIISKISAASRCLENKLLKDIGQQQLAIGRITVKNQSPSLRRMYTYFRQLAIDTYDQNRLVVRPSLQVEGEPSVFAEVIDGWDRRTEGFFCTVAMTNAYFSLLEHLLVLALPATDFEPTKNLVTEFIGMRLFDKYDRVFNDPNDSNASSFRKRLHDAAERWRNPYAHGGFDKANGTIAFHLPEISALPVLLSDIRTHPTFHLVPEREMSFDQLCSLFDELDTWLRTGPIAHGIEWAEEGLDVPFNPESLSAFRRAASKGPEAFSNFVAHTSHGVDMATNMDW